MQRLVQVSPEYKMSLVQKTTKYPSIPMQYLNEMYDYKWGETLYPF